MNKPKMMFFLFWIFSKSCWKLEYLCYLKKKNLLPNEEGSDWIFDNISGNSESNGNVEIIFYLNSNFVFSKTFWTLGKKKKKKIKKIKEKQVKEVSKIFNAKCGHSTKNRFYLLLKEERDAKCSETKKYVFGAKRIHMLFCDLEDFFFLKKTYILYHSESILILSKSFQAKSNLRPNWKANTQTNCTKKH